MDISSPKDGQSALGYAVHKGNLKLTKLLLQFGASPNQADKIMRSTPVHFVCNLKYPNIELVKLLLEHGGDTLQKENLRGNNRTCLHYASHNQTADAELIKLLLDNKADPREKDSLVCFFENYFFRTKLSA